MRGVWIVEFLHSNGWTPLEMPIGGRRREAVAALRKWRERKDSFEYRAVKYVPKPSGRASGKGKT